MTIIIPKPLRLGSPFPHLSDEMMEKLASTVDGYNYTAEYLAPLFTSSFIYLSVPITGHESKKPPTWHKHLETWAKKNGYLLFHPLHKVHSYVPNAIDKGLLPPETLIAMDCCLAANSMVTVVDLTHSYSFGCTTEVLAAASVKNMVIGVTGKLPVSIFSQHFCSNLVKPTELIPFLEKTI